MNIIAGNYSLFDWLDLIKLTIVCVVVILSRPKALQSVNWLDLLRAFSVALQSAKKDDDKKTPPPKNPSAPAVVTGSSPIQNVKLNP